MEGRGRVIGEGRDERTSENRTPAVDIGKRRLAWRMKRVVMKLMISIEMKEGKLNLCSLLRIVRQSLFCI